MKKKTPPVCVCVCVFVCVCVCVCACLCVCVLKKLGSKMWMRIVDRNKQVKFADEENRQKNTPQHDAIKKISKQQT